MIETKGRKIVERRGWQGGAGHGKEFAGKRKDGKGCAWKAVWNLRRRSTPQLGYEGFRRGRKKKCKETRP